MRFFTVMFVIDSRPGVGLTYRSCAPFSLRLTEITSNLVAGDDCVGALAACPAVPESRCTAMISTPATVTTTLLMKLRSFEVRRIIMSSIRLLLVRGRPLRVIDNYYF